MVIAAVVLAAGKSTRMGRPKALLPVDGADTFIGRIVETFLIAGVTDIAVVVGYAGDAIAERLARRHPLVPAVFNADYESGQLSSLQAGLQAVLRPDLDAVLLTLVDVPLVSATTVRAVLERYAATRAPVVRPVHPAHDGRHGHPVLIDRALFPALFAADPRVGAKPVIRAHVSSAGEVPIEDEGAFVDIDTPEEYRRVLGQLPPPDPDHA